jgi:hypothetical protein
MYLVLAPPTVCARGRFSRVAVVTDRAVVAFLLERERVELTFRARLASLLVNSKVAARRALEYMDTSGLNDTNMDMDMDMNVYITLDLSINQVHCVFATFALVMITADYQNTVGCSWCSWCSW